MDNPLLSLFDEFDQKESKDCIVITKPIKFKFCIGINSPRIITKPEDNDLLKYIVYKTTNKINGKIYVGQRLMSNRKDNWTYLGSGDKIIRSVKKYGKRNFYRETIEWCYKHNINSRETYWIDKLDSRNTLIGYNIHRGGIGGKSIIRPEEIKKKISDSLKGRTWEDIYGINGAQKRREQALITKNKNKKLKDDKKKEKGKRISSFKGKHHTEEQKEKWRVERKGKNIGEKNGFYKKHHTKEQKEKWCNDRKNKKRGKYKKDTK